MTTLVQIDGLAPLAKADRKKSKVMLLFPPEWVPTAPYLALPSLTAVLREAGHTVIQRDINIGMWDHFFSMEFLIWVKARLGMQLKMLQEKEKAGELTERELNQLPVVEQAHERDVFDLADRAEDAKQIVRGERFYNAELLEGALNTFRETMAYISSAYYPASLVFYPMESNLGYRPGVSKEVFACLEDEQVNVYRDLCNQLVLPEVAKEQPDVIGISIGTQMQLLAGLTFSKLIKESFPQIHLVVGGNVITRLHEDLVHHERFFAEVFDSAILYEGEHALLWLIEALNGQRPLASVPNLIYRDASGLHRNSEVYTEKTTSLPLPDFDGMPLDRYFVPELIIPYLATRGCYWGRCTFCDHGQGYFDQYRGMPAQLVIDQIKALRDKYQCRHFLFSDESYPPALFRKVSQLLVDQNVGIKWTTLIRFEETLQDQATWDLAAKAGCCTLYYGMESANERVLNLMDKHAKKDVIQRNLQMASKAGIWNHVMAFYGFPGETFEEALETRQFVVENQPVIHSLELFYFVAYRHTPMVRKPEQFGITIHKQEEYDLPLDYYYTLNDPSTLSCLDAMQLCEEFYKHDFHPWAVRVNSREHVFLYISKYGTNQLPQIYAQQTQPVGSADGVSGLITWPVAQSSGDEGMSRVTSHEAS
ncbi:MAG: B12-binding domain-containing radical SAM protein [Nitrospira sp.]|nr:B12-binding domain-containing radical SAM protein [Nitrospira sp.]MDH4303882.1 B12-binding domain-containing radical SAM protein [Nitrospira sp.]MDH5192742.1 B12-binding domain-containing radical SAM protein [Nitrospira sp.]